jgi:peroxiredoxin family protein
MDKLQVATVGNPSMGMPTFIGGIPGMGAFATSMMKKEMDKLEIPPVSEMIAILDASGAELYACKMAMDMFGLEKDDLVPEVKDVLTAMDFWELAEGAQIVFI